MFASLFIYLFIYFAHKASVCIFLFIFRNQEYKVVAKKMGVCVSNINMLFVYDSKERGKMSKSRHRFCRKGSQVADAILIKLLLGNNGTAFAKWARFSEMRRRAPCMKHAHLAPYRKASFLYFKQTEPLAERHANTKLFLFLYFSFSYSSPGRHAEATSRLSPSALTYGAAAPAACRDATRHTHAVRPVSRSNMSTTANSQARHSHVNECGSKSQS